MTNLNEAARPKAPKLHGVTPAQRAKGRHLAAIHRLHLRDMAQLKALIEQIEHDRAAATTLADTLDTMAMAENLRRFGALCGRECNHLFFHHGAEEQQLFPAIETRAGAAFAPLIAKLRAEHEVIHALITALRDGAQALIASPDDATYTALRDTFTRLHAGLKSHFHYEETELEEALGTFDIF